ncbi:2-methylpropanoate--CoA ligase ccl4 [Ranunculus cassubicifolius]
MDQFKPRPANSSPLTPLRFLERAATVYADCVSIVYGVTTYTWSQTHQRCLQMASSLSSIGIRPGEVVSVIAPNIPAMYELHFAVPMCGAVLNTINIRLDARTVSVLLGHSGSKLVFVDHFSCSLVLEAISLLPPKTQLPILISINTDNENSSPSALGSDFSDTYESLMEKGDAGYKWVEPATEWAPMVLNYTSGTTSAPKGVVHSHRGIYIVTVDSLVEWSVPKQPIYLWTLPMFHANGWCFPWGMAAVGGTNVCLRRFDAAKLYREISRNSVTHMCGAPVVLNLLANAPNQEPLSHPVHIMTAGAPPPAPVLLRTESLGFVVSHGYGLTETAGIVISCAWKHEWNRFPVSDQARLKARQGVRTNGIADMDVVDGQTGLSVKRDGLTMGEVVVRGGSVMLGYLHDPVGTDKCMTESGWFYTGDVGVMHPDGYMELKDRSKDVIISGGENISSVEVESTLYAHPAVNEAAVVARPDEFWGESPCAFVCLKHDSVKPTEKEILEFCRSRMPHFMAPKTVIFTTELPKSSTGKIYKSVLRKQAKAWGGI